MMVVGTVSTKASSKLTVPATFKLSFAAGATSEKRTRGQLKAAVDRALSKDKVVVLDSLNGIKGYR